MGDIVQSATVLTNYLDYKSDMPLNCPVCGWAGKADLAEREMHNDLFDISCPECSKMLLVVPYPTYDQVKDAAAAGNQEALQQLPSVLREE